MTLYVLFLFRLAENLGVTVQFLLTGKFTGITQGETLLWLDYRQRFGFKSERVEYAIANGATAQCNAWGAHYQPENFIPKFRGKLSRGGLKKALYTLAMLGSAKVTFVPKDGSQPQEGLKALANLDDWQEPTHRTKKEAGQKTLDSGERPKLPAKRVTLGGD